MTNVVIVVKNGMIQEILCRNKNVEVELLDLDDQDIESLKEKNSGIKSLGVQNHTKTYYENQVLSCLSRCSN